MINGRYPKDAIQHHTDEIAQQILENRVASQKHIRDLIHKAVNELETDFYLENLADNTRVSAKLMPHLHHVHTDVCSRLQVKPPTLFIDTNPSPNAWTLGAAHPSVVITSSLLDLMTEDELRFVLGHEVGHLLCDHTKYRVMTDNYHVIASLISLIPLLGTAFSALLQISLNFWFRRSELSADRFGVLSCQDPYSAISALAKLAGGRRDLDTETLKAGMLEQAHEFREAFLARGQVATLWDVIDGLIGRTSTMTHPWPAVRMWEIEHWLPSEHHAALVRSDFERARAEKHRVESFFVIAADASKDPFQILLSELTGELGKGVGDLLQKGRSIFGDMLRKPGQHDPPQGA